MGEKPQLMTLRDVPLAIGLLTRLPLPVDPAFARSRGAAAAWAYPMAGLAAALIAAGVALAAQGIGLPDTLAAGLALATLAIVTGAMHEDGLADSADGLWGGWDTARRLEIMKDSRIGTYGVIALVLSFGLRWSALAALSDMMAPVLLVAAMLSRATMCVVMGRLDHARADGLSQSVGRPSPGTWGLGLALAIGLSLALLGPAVLWMVGICGVIALGAARIARQKIGGQTGDILGAVQQLTEIGCLVAATLFVLP